MKTKELIAALQKEDPSGEYEVLAEGDPIFFVEALPAWYDGPMKVLEQDQSGHCIGYKVTKIGNKIRLHTMSLGDFVIDYPNIEVDLSGLDKVRQEQYKEYIEKVKNGTENE